MAQPEFRGGGRGGGGGEEEKCMYVCARVKGLGHMAEARVGDRGWGDLGKRGGGGHVGDSSNWLGEGT